MYIFFAYFIQNGNTFKKRKETDIYLCLPWTKNCAERFLFISVFMTVLLGYTVVFHMYG